MAETKIEQFRGACSTKCDDDAARTTVCHLAHHLCYAMPKSLSHAHTLLLDSAEIFSE